jgi:ribosomal protein S20
MMPNIGTKMREVYRASIDQLNKLVGDEDMVFAYHLLIYYLNCEYHYFPDYNHTKFNDLKCAKKQSSFKYLLKYVKDNKTKFTTQAEYFIFIKAQMEIIKLLESVNPIISPSLLIGEKAEKRYFVWRKKMAETKMVTKTITRKLDEKIIASAIEKSIQSLKDTLENEFTYENFQKNIKRVLLQIRAKQIDPIWCFCSEWVQELPEEIKKEIISISECERYKDYNVEDIKKIYNERFNGLLLINTQEVKS